MEEKGGKSSAYKFIKEPLVHFLLAGFCFFILYRQCGPPSNDLNFIKVDQGAIMDYMQYQSNTFNKEVFQAQFLDLSNTEKENLAYQLVRDEVLYRKAIVLALDKNDYVIKRRIIQKMEFLLDDFDATKINVVEDSLIAFYNRNQKRYFSPAYISFSHIYFKGEEAQRRALDFLRDIENKTLTVDESLPMGDRFMYQRNYIEKNEDFVASQFGKAFADRIFALPLEKAVWLGPIKSDHGYHLVRMIDRSEPSIKKLEEIHPLVKEDYLLYLKGLYNEQKIEDLKKEFKVELDLN